MIYIMQLSFKQYQRKLMGLSLDREQLVLSTAISSVRCRSSPNLPPKEISAARLLAFEVVLSCPC